MTDLAYPHSGRGRPGCRTCGHRDFRALRGFPSVPLFVAGKPMALEVGDMVRIWPGTRVTVQAVKGDSISVLWFDGDEVRRKVVDQWKVWPDA